ncbi:MAG: hypothetical protein HY235_11670 [Acidobacteria bacterium]|nr:hypothetical protein [Acidobacteriota bacterium]
MNRAEELAQWYFRLNGFLTLPNFILHPDRPGSQRTDADIIGIRFPHRRELSSDAIDDQPFAQQQWPYLVLAEVKSSYVALNKAWTDGSRQNIQAILRAVGIFEVQRLDDVAGALYSCGVWNPGDGVVCSLFLVGDCVNRESPARYVKVPHRNWDQVLAFIHGRFRRFYRLKTQNDQWGPTGKKLWELSVAHEDQRAFQAAARKAFCLRSDAESLARSC